VAGVEAVGDKGRVVDALGPGTVPDSSSTVGAVFFVEG
jgi:hypothetical protein